MYEVLPWREGLERFDEERILYPLIKSEKDLIRSAVSGRKPDRDSNEGMGRLNIYEGPFYTEIEGWPVTISDAEVLVITPEYLADREWGQKVSPEELNRRLEDLKKRWGDKTEHRKYGGMISVNIGSIDEKLSLKIQTQNFSQSSYGTFIAISRADRTVWPYVKFDYQKDGLWPENHSLDDDWGGYFYGDEMYNYIEGLIQIAKDCDCGISTKELHRSNQGKGFLLDNYLHIYPRLEQDISGSEQEIEMGISRIEAIYSKGKAIWGDKFRVNPYVRGTGKLREVLGELERGN